MFAALLFAAFLPIGPLATVVVSSAALLVGALAILFPDRRVLRPAEITCGAGHVDVRAPNGRRLRIDAQTLRGATTARTDGGVLLTLATSNDSPPVTLELENEEDVAQVRRALGIGHGGFGTINWHGTVSGNARAGRTGWALAGLIGVSGLVTAAASPIGAPLIFGIIAAMGLPIALLLMAIGAIPGATLPNIVMAPDGLRLRALNGNFLFFPYASIRSIAENPGSLWFAVPPPYGMVGTAAGKPVGRSGLSDDERAILVAQLGSATQRALGRGATKEDIRGRLDVLRRRGESLVAWLSRLDHMGRALATGAGYRGLDVDVEAVWAVLEDPEAEVELRVAAARVLRHTGDEASGERINAALAATHGALETRRLRVAIRDDLEAAGEDLALLEAEMALEEQHPAFAAAARQRGHR